MSGENSIQVNFGKAMPLFPLDAVTLLPQQLLPLHVFEERYRQMVEHALDGSGQIAMAVFAGDQWKQNYHGRPPLRPAVCVGQIVQHEKLADGRYNVLVQGVCRARIIHELPMEEGRLYRLAMLEPVGLDPTTMVVSEIEADEEDEETGEEPDLGLPPPPEPEGLSEVRTKICEMLAEGPLTQLVAAEPVLEFVRNEEVPTAPLLELVSFMLITDQGLRYKLLAEASIQSRAKLIMHELEHLSDLIRRAGDQRPQDWPKGMSWN
ncbi:MAG TPA: LON peptidase substrate-binding domain-containing protein [Phycisphaerales bacterium]|nr:LON peptidase substrate-binding domain-containing protein [Phycisphaerales bacterium]